jgi:PhnB protein
MQWYPHLAFNGHCEKAFQFYEKCFGGEIILMMRYAEAPMETPPEMKKKVAHATFAVGDQMFSGSDAMSANYVNPQGFHIQLNLRDAVEAERIFRTLAEDGSVEMALQETFWALRYGALVDQFGVPWEINCEKGNQ